MSRIWRNLICSVIFSALWASVASAQTIFYVDPDYGSGNGTPNGSASAPWVRLGSSEWSQINSRLSAADVIVYFSSTEAGGAAAESYGTELLVQRTNTASFRLTLDGMTKYNVNDAAPSWQNTPGTFRLKLVNGGSGLALGWHSGLGQQSNITLRGFETSGTNGRVIFGGDNLIVEHIYVHDVTANGPGMLLMYAPYDDGSCKMLGISNNVTIRNNTIERTYGEGLYIGGTDNCPALGNTHDTILIENNTISHPGVNGAQGDGIDLKDGLTNVTVRRNRIADTHAGSGITVAGGYGTQNQNIVIEWNEIYRSSLRGILVGSSWGDPRGYTIRSNTIVNSASIGISLSGGTNAAIDIFDISILSNTIANNVGAGIAATYTRGLLALNNLVFANNAAIPNHQITVDTATANSGSALNDYNLYSPGSTQANANTIAGPNNQILSDYSGLIVDPSNPGWGALSTPAAPTGLRILTPG